MAGATTYVVPLTAGVDRVARCESPRDAAEYGAEPADAA